MSEIVQEIFSDKIDDPEHAMRSELNRDELFELADNIKQNGLINPITVRPKNNRFEVVAGHRRLAACKIAGQIKIPCVVRELDDNQTFAVMAAENLERADVDPVDEALFIKRYIEQTNLSVPDVAKTLRRSLAYVESRLAVGQMPDYMQEYLKSGTLKLGVALALFEIDNELIRKSWTDRAVEQGVSVQTAQWQLHDYKTNKAMYDGVMQTIAPGEDLPAPKPIMFRCAIDGKDYDARLCKSIIVSETNLEIFNAFVSEFRSVPSEN
jgi:ParB family chromosome partitioning protein